MLGAQHEPTLDERGDDDDRFGTVEDVLGNRVVRGLRQILEHVDRFRDPTPLVGLGGGEGKGRRQKRRQARRASDTCQSPAPWLIRQM